MSKSYHSLACATPDMSLSIVAQAISFFYNDAERLSNCFSMAGFKLDTHTSEDLSVWKSGTTDLTLRHGENKLKSATFRQTDPTESDLSIEIELLTSGKPTIDLQDDIPLLEWVVPNSNTKCSKCDADTPLPENRVLVVEPEFMKNFSLCPSLDTFIALHTKRTLFTDMGIPGYDTRRALGLLGGVDEGSHPAHGFIIDRIIEYSRYWDLLNRVSEKPINQKYGVLRTTKYGTFRLASNQSPPDPPEGLFVSGVDLVFSLAALVDADALLNTPTVLCESCGEQQGVLLESGRWFSSTVANTGRIPLAVTVRRNSVKEKNPFIDNIQQSDIENEHGSVKSQLEETVDTDPQGALDRTVDEGGLISTGNDRFVRRLRGALLDILVLFIFPTLVCWFLAWLFNLSASFGAICVVGFCLGLVLLATIVAADKSNNAS